MTPAHGSPSILTGLWDKISVDRRLLMNKGLELIEACHLFAISDGLTVVVHPPSIIHSIVQYVDRSTLAQMGNPDMCTPIAHALAWPESVFKPMCLHLTCLSINNWIFRNLIHCVFQALKTCTSGHANGRFGTPNSKCCQ